MSRSLEGRVALVTGAGRGLGRAHALTLAREGAIVVVNDHGVALDGSNPSTGPAQDVVDEIHTAGGQAVADTSDVSEPTDVQRLFALIVDQYGTLDVVVNNAGILRDRTLAKMTVDEWDAVIRVHLRGTYCTSHEAAALWRARSKEGRPVDGRIVNTASPAIFGAVGQSNYGAAKAGIVGFTLTAAIELAPYGATVNAVLPVANTRMTATIADRPGDGAPPDDAERRPERVSPVVAWLASDDAADVTGRVISVRNGRVGVLDGWALGPEAQLSPDLPVASVGELVGHLARTARPNPGLDGRVREART